MATLVQFLAAGVNGAASGTATFLLRGTASSAASVLYNDFERVVQPASNIITLDANGAAEVYCSAYCDVTLKNAAGATLRTVTVGGSAATVEVRSDSFTGTDYDGSPANTVSEPITLSAVLDKWNNSAGTTNWKVLVGGVAANLQDAFGNLATVTSFVNVKSPAFGAQGDGVTDDTTPIENAIAAANGAIVFFPPGIYITSSSISLSDANFILMGCGYGASIIRRTSAGDEVFTVSDTTAGSLKVFDGLGFEGQSANQTLELGLAPNVSIRNCSFDRPVTRSSSSGDVRISIQNCRFSVAGSRYAILNDSSAGESAISVTDCVFVAAAGYTGIMVEGPDFSIQGCLFDASLVISGIYYHIQPGKNVGFDWVGSFVGNKFIDGGSSGFAFYLQDVNVGSGFHEAANVFVGFTEPALLTDSGHIYNYTNAPTYDYNSRIYLGSRLGKQLTFVNAASASIANINAQLVADHIVITHTNASNLTVSFDSNELPSAMEYLAVVVNNSGGTRTITFAAAGQSIAVAGVVNGAKAFALYRTVTQSAGDVDSIIVSSGQTA